MDIHRERTSPESCATYGTMLLGFCWDKDEQQSVPVQNLSVQAENPLQNLLYTQMGTSSSTAYWQQHWAAHLSVKNQLQVHGSLGYTQLSSSTCTRKEIKYCCSQFHGNSKIIWLPRCQYAVADKASVWSWPSCFSLCINPCSSSAPWGRGYSSVCP